MADSIDVEGFRDIFNMWRNGTIGDVMELIDAVKSKDAAKIRASVVKIASGFGYAMEAKEVDDVVAEVMQKDWAGVVYELGDAMMKFSVAHMGYVVPTQPIVVKASGPGESEYFVGDDGAPIKIKDATRAQSRQYYANNREKVRDAAKCRYGKWALRHAPEVQALLAADSPAAVAAALADVKAISPERLDQIINALRWASKALVVAAAFFPPWAVYLIAASRVLNLIISFYDSNHLNASGVEVDRGLSLEDL